MPTYTHVCVTNMACALLMQARIQEAEVSAATR